MKLEEYLLEIESFIKEYLSSCHMENLVLGLSGGVDSSLVAAIAQKAVGKEHLTCLLMPIESNPDDLNDAMEIVKTFDLNYVVLDGSRAFNQLKQEFIDNKIELNVATLSNLKVRIRMSMLYAYAQKVNGLVLGTDNMDERYTGYFTKYGDGAADMLPIVYLTKQEVVEAAKIMGVPANLAERVPSAGLFDGQTDEKEMGVTYKDLDSYLLGNRNLDPKVIERIQHLHKISEHKRNPIPTPKEFVR